MIVRKMEHSDIDFVYDIEKKSFSDAWSKTAFYDELENDLAKYFVGEVNGVVVSYIGYWKVFDESQITVVAVDKDYRNNGIAKDMIKKIVELAKKDGVGYISLEVRQSNVPAINLYLSMGFEKIGVRKKYYIDNKEDAVLMEKII